MATVTKNVPLAAGLSDQTVALGVRMTPTWASFQHGAT